MGFRLLILPPAEQTFVSAWPNALKELIPEITVDLCQCEDEAMAVVEQTDAAYGYIGPELFARAKKLKWVASPLIGPKASFFHQALIESDVVVTNMRGTFNDHVSAHAMAFVLAFARGFHGYLAYQNNRRWQRDQPTVHLPEAVAVILGVGAIGAETARLCSAFGINVIGIDARQTEPPSGVTELHPPDALPEVLPRGDFVISILPETPQTQGLFAAEQFRRMKSSAYFINVGRGATVVLDDLVAALKKGEIAGAGLDVFEVEPLPEDHSLWTTPGVLMTPHVGGEGPYVDERRTEVFMENCVRFNEGKPLINVVNKAEWF